MHDAIAVQALFQLAAVIQRRAPLDVLDFMGE